MEDLDNEILDELKQKSIERSDDLVIDEVNSVDEELLEEPTVAPSTPPPPVKKTKKQRSQKQIEAFEKARIKRAENLKIKKQIEAEKKAKLKEEKELVKKEVKQRLQKKEVLNLPPTETVDHAVQRYKEVVEPERYREQVIHNYYYYGQPPPGQFDDYDSPKPKAKKKKKKVKFVPQPEPETETESDSELSEAEEPQSYKELQNYQEDDYRPPAPRDSHPQLKFRFC